MSAGLANGRGVGDYKYAGVAHIRAMLTLAKQKHEAAILMLGKPDAAAIPRLQEVLKLIEEVELLADDAGSYVDSSDMKGVIKELHMQQASLRLAITQLEHGPDKSPWATPWPWVALTAIILALAQMA